MPVIRHNDREIFYENHDMIPYIKVFHQDYIPISAGTDYTIQAVSAGKAREDMDNLGNDHIKTFFFTKPFLEKKPELIPSYNYIIYEGKEKKFPYMDILNAGILAPNQLIISYRLMGILQKYRMAPHIIAPVVVKHRDTFIDDYYIMVYFWHHGCDLADWENTVFAWVDSRVFQNIQSTFALDSFEEYKRFRENPVIEQHIPLSISFKDKYDIFYSDLGMNIFIPKILLTDLKEEKIKNLTLRRLSTEIVSN